MILAAGLLLLLAVAFVVLELCVRAEVRCDAPEEPWAEWDGEVPLEMVDGSPRDQGGVALGHHLGPGEIQELGRRR